MKTEARALQRNISLMNNLELFVAATRPREWIKNTFLFAPLFFAQKVLQPEAVLKSTLAFAVFCLAAGGVYLINDICDREEDKKHPQKSARPIASGALSVSLAVAAAIVLFAISIAVALALSWPFAFITLSYIILNLAYSNWLKHVVILDVFLIAFGFVLRVAGGAVVIDVVMSHWLVICTMLLALFLGFSKRRHELVTLASDDRRRVLAEYNPLFLDMMIGIVTSATVVSYALYTVSPETVQRFHTDRLLFTLPLVLYGVFRYLYLIYQRNHGGDPSQTLLTDRPLLINIGLWAVACGIIIYTANL
jgi:4-hydroxybenzoate polyprenyltransferase